MEQKHRRIIIDVLNQHIRAINRAIDVTDEITAGELKQKRDDIVQVVHEIEFTSNTLSTHNVPQGSMPPL